MKHHTPFRLVIAMIGIIATGLTQAMDYGEGRANHSDAIALDNAGGIHAHWRAVGRLQMTDPTSQSRCTAALIDSRDRISGLSGPAYILTSGHCVSKHSLNFTNDLPVTGHIDFDYFLGNTQNTERYALKKVIRATMRGTDLALIELDSPLQALLEKGIEPLALSGQAPVAGMDLMIVGAPSGHEEAPGLRLALCAYQAQEDLVEDVYVFRRFLKHRCAGVAAGSSGSPVLDRQTNRIVAVLSTSTTNAREENRCQDNAPCEIKNGQPVWSPETQYSSPAIDLKTCFSQGHFNPLDTECVLYPTLHMTLGDTYSPKTYSRITLDEQGNAVAPRWSWPFSLDTALYRYKAARSPSACESPHGYSGVLDATQALIDEQLQADPGMHLLCIVGVGSATQPPEWAVMNKPVIVAMEVVPPGPTRMPELMIERLTEGGYAVRPYRSRPSLWVYTFKSGAPETTQCDDPEGYTPEFGDVKTIDVTQLPLTLCSRVYDMSRQASLPRTDLLLP
ncbi:serine protease [Pseudomonas sp. LS-2]|jgi:V8-like Glu-specific endopeptidase|nr:serine protease [Pseudomonas sp. LS-2]